MVLSQGLVLLLSLFGYTRGACLCSYHLQSLAFHEHGGSAASGRHDKSLGAWRVIQKHAIYHDLFCNAFSPCDCSQSFVPVIYGSCLCLWDLSFKECAQAFVELIDMCIYISNPTHWFNRCYSFPDLFICIGIL